MLPGAGGIGLSMASGEAHTLIYYYNYCVINSGGLLFGWHDDRIPCLKLNDRKNYNFIFKCMYNLIDY